MRFSIVQSISASLVLLVSCDNSVTSVNDEAEVEAVVTDIEYRKGEYFWKPSRIAMTLHDGDHFGTPGQYILLENNLAAGEYGWGSTNLDLPETWEIRDLRFDGLAIRFENNLDESFSIQPPKLNELDFDLLSGGTKGDKALEKLWRHYALFPKTRKEQAGASNPSP